MKTTNRPNIFTSFIGLALIVLTLLSGMGCSTELDLNAEPKDIWVVYGILRQEAEVQDIRIAKAFLIAGDAIEYAKNNDQSIQGLNVTLTDSRGREFIATQVDSVPTTPEDGTFFPYTTLYRFDTPEANPIRKGERYTLKVTRPGTDTFELTSHTHVPLEPTILKPEIVFCPQNQFRLTPLQLHNRYDVEWRKGRPIGGVPGGPGLGFELRTFWNYEKNGDPQAEIPWGPTSLIVEGGGCQSSGTNLCYRIPEGDLLNHFLFNMEQEDGFKYTFNSTTDCKPTDQLSRALEFEVTAIDTFLTNYIRVNNPGFTDFNTVRIEYTNISGTETALGVFGSTTISRRSGGLDQCSQWLLNMNDTPQPTSANCSL